MVGQVLVTGATGTLGKAIVEAALGAPTTFKEFAEQANWNGGAH